jgi:hypothetical protein
LFFGHGGAYFPETIYFWGAYANANYGWQREGKPLSQVDNSYIRHHYTGATETSVMMLEYSAHTSDRQFLGNIALPFAEEVLEFYDKHYGRDKTGKLRMEPAQSLETFYGVVNPLPDVAGLQYLLDTLLDLPEATPQQRSRWQRLRHELPEIPIGAVDGAKVLLPAQQISKAPQNVENPELYAVFPFRLFGVGKPDLELARRSFSNRRIKNKGGWAQDDIQAAMLGLADEARDLVTQRFADKHRGSRFPAFWGPNFDWIPDQDHGNVGLMALQAMLLQSGGDKILLLPAWPATWDVEFKLHAPQNTVVEGVYRGAKVVWFQVTPAARMKDVVLPATERTPVEPARSEKSAKKSPGRN